MIVNCRKSCAITLGLLCMMLGVLAGSGVLR